MTTVGTIPTLRRIADPIAWPLTAFDVAAQARIDDAEPADLVQRYVAAATDAAETFLRRALLPQRWELITDTWTDRLWLPYAAPLLIEPPPASPPSPCVETSDGAGGWQDAPDGYAIAATTPYSLVRTAPLVATPVRVTYRAGWPDPTRVPPAIVQGLALLVGHWIAHREAVVVGTITADLPWGVRALWGPHQLFDRRST